MLLAYVAHRDANGDSTRLSIIPAETNEITIPVWVDLLCQSSAGVFWIGPRESVIVRDEASAKIISRVPPAELFLTPDNPTRPGLKVNRIKIEFLGNNAYEVFYAKESEERWLKWDPLTQVR